MASTQLILDDLIHQLRESPGRTKDQIVQDLLTTYGCSEFTARAVLARAAYALDRETQRWRIIRRRTWKPLPGETSGLFDNLVRLLEDAALH